MLNRHALTLYCSLLTVLAFPQVGLTHELGHSDISADEHVILFRTAARFEEATEAWQIPIHGWIYEPEDSVSRRALFTTILKEKFDLAPDEDTNANFTRRLNLLIADNERGKRIFVTIGGKDYELPLSGVNGHFKTTLSIPSTVIVADTENSIIEYSVVTGEGESRSFSGEVMLVQPEGLSIISDIDDTVKVSNIGYHKRLLESTFLLDFAAAPGMAELYEKLSTPDIAFHFVSSSPWQLYEPLDDFLKDSGFPTSTLNLKPVRFRDTTLFDLFKKGTETKPAVIESILDAYPRRRFILVGDSGEHDPEVYAGIFRKYPEQIEKIYIRNVSDESSDNGRFTEVFDGIDPECWELFDDPATLTPDS